MMQMAMARTGVPDKTTYVPAIKVTIIAEIERMFSTVDEALSSDTWWRSSFIDSRK